MNMQIRIAIALFALAALFGMQASAQYAPPGGIGTSPVFHARVTLTAAQLGALKATPTTIVTAPGSGKKITPIFASLYLHPGSSAWVAPMSTFDPFLTTAAQDTYSNMLLAAEGNVPGFTVLMPNTSAQLVYMSTILNGNPTAQHLNAPLILALPTDASGDWTAGNGTAVLEIYYTIDTP